MGAKAKVAQVLMKALESKPFELPSQPRDKLNFKSSAAESERLSLRNACVCAGAEVRVAGELDLSPDILILDYGLGTIGLVHILEQSPDASLVEQAKGYVDQATYLRHLLVTGHVAAGIPGFRLDYTVECVLAIRQDRMHKMIDVVREIAAKTRFLHAIGLNLLPFTRAVKVDSKELQRAFAWLLPAVRQRLSACTPPPAPRLRGLELLNYRLPDRRRWALTGNRVHLLHGANGTGKSSFAEALELVVTGSVERIKNHSSADYAAIIRNSPPVSKRPPSVSLLMSDGSQRRFTVTATGISKGAIHPELAVTAFRLDQTVMDQLVRADSQQRARVLTRAFFPGEAYDNLERAQNEFNKAYQELPFELRQELQAIQPDANKRHLAVDSRLKWVEEPAIVPENVDDCLPLKRETLETLARIVPEIHDALTSLNAPADRTTFESNLGKLDEALRRIRSNVRFYRDAVVQSLAALQRLAQWAPSPDQATLGYADLLRGWSERVALSDLLKKHLEISKSLLDARAESWAPDESHGPGLLSASVESLQQSLSGLTEMAARCTEEQTQLFKQLLSPSAAAGQGKPAPPSTLSASEIESLNLTCAWFGRQEPTPPKALFGETVQAAVSGNTSEVYGSITIGSQEWTKRPAEFLAPLEPALNELLALEPRTGPASSTEALVETAESPIYRSPLTRLHAFQAAVTHARQVDVANQCVEETLMKRLTEHKLNEALNELIALFTPARWAYEGLVVSPKVHDGKVGVELLTSETRSQAEVRLNTAELNLVILALYLMCGPTTNNPLGTLILDDPLQNMDELTSATVARGVSKIAALLPEGWQLMMMFHGEEDLETFRREVPGSVYYLPWLGPIAAASSDGNGVRQDSRQTRGATKSRELAAVMERRAQRTFAAKDRNRSVHRRPSR